MADNEKETPGETMERHLFSEGMDTHTAESALQGLLSEEGIDLFDVESEEGSRDEDDPNPSSEAGEPEDAPESDPEVELDEIEYEPEGEEDEDDLLDGEVEPEDEDEPEEDEEPEELITVKVDGEEHEVTLEELKAGFSFQAHNTRRSQELAAREQEIEQEAAEVREMRERYARGLDQLGEALREVGPSEPDWEKLEREDPSRYAVEYAKWQREQQKLGALETERNRVHQERVEEAQRQLAEYRAEQEEKLIEAVPEWKDPDTARKDLAEIRDWAKNQYGFTDEQIGQIMDHRSVLLMRQAMQYDRMRKKGKDVVEGKRKRSKKQTLKPRTRKSAKRTTKAARAAKDARRRLAESGSRQDASELLFALLQEE